MNKKAVFFLLCILAVFLEAAPIPLRDNLNRIWDRDSVKTIVFDKESDFWSLHNFSFQIANRYTFADDSTISGNRLMIHAMDSIRYRILNINVSVFFDQRGIYGTNVDWVKPGGSRKDDFDPRSSIDMQTLTFAIEPTDWITVRLGKDNYNWGPLELGGLMLSNWNPGLTGLYQEYNLGAFSIKGLATQLNSSPWGHSTVSADPKHRFFSASRVEIYRERWGCAIAQSVIYSGEGRSFEIPYLIPVFPFHYAQIADWRYGNNGDNTFGGIDAYVRFWEKQIEIYGEILIDDFQADQDDVSQSVQNNIAWMAGSRFKIRDILYGCIEGGQINSFVYNHISGYASQYRYKNAFIGSPLGPDQKLLWGSLGHRFKKIPLTIEATGWYRQSGERNIDAEYPIVNELPTVVGTANDPTPFGTVEKEKSAWLTLSAFLFNTEIECVGGFTQYQNYEHTAGKEKNVLFAGLYLRTGINLQWKSAAQ